MINNKPVFPLIFDKRYQQVYTNMQMAVTPKQRKLPFKRFKVYCPSYYLSTYDTKYNEYKPKNNSTHAGRKFLICDYVTKVQ